MQVGAESDILVKRHERPFVFRKGGHDVGGYAVVAEIERCDEYCQQGESY